MALIHLFCAGADCTDLTLAELKSVVHQHTVSGLVLHEHNSVWVRFDMTTTSKCSSAMIQCICDYCSTGN